MCDTVLCELTECCTKYVTLIPGKLGQREKPQNLICKLTLLTNNSSLKCVRALQPLERAPFLNNYQWTRQPVECSNSFCSIPQRSVLCCSSLFETWNCIHFRKEKELSFGFTQRPNLCAVGVVMQSSVMFPDWWVRQDGWRVTRSHWTVRFAHKRNNSVQCVCVERKLTWTAHDHLHHHHHLCFW